MASDTGNQSGSQKPLLPAPSSSGGGNTKLIVSAIVGFAVGVGAAWLWGMNKEVAEAPTVNDGKTVTGTTTDTNNVQSNTVSGSTIGKNIVVVEDQDAGTRVFVKQVILQTVGWVVIHERVNGQVGNALGAGRFEAGTNEGEIELLRATEAGRMYFALLYKDDGDKLFDLKKDTRLTDTSGQSVQATFWVVTK